jgi:hypothetical protein
MADNANNLEDSKPSAKLDALAEIAAAESEGGGGSIASSANQDPSVDQPSEVTPANTFESSASAAKPPDASTTDKTCPWKNRQDLIALWKKRYAELVAYHAAHGHVNVPQRYEDNPELGRWVKDQRAFRRSNKLSKERISLLDELGFIWKLKRPDDFWAEKLGQLVEYKDQTGSVNPPREGDTKLLACWVDRQRRAGRKGKLTTERVRKLNEVGFVWDPRGDGGNEVVGNDEVCLIFISFASDRFNIS